MTKENLSAQSTPGPLSVLDNGRSLVHVETGEGHPLGVGRAIASFTRNRKLYAELLARAPDLAAELEFALAERRELRTKAIAYREERDKLAAENEALKLECLARSNAIRQAHATVRCAIERGSCPGATADDVLRVLATLSIPESLTTVREEGRIS